MQLAGRQMRKFAKACLAAGALGFGLAMAGGATEVAAQGWWPWATQSEPPPPPRPPPHRGPPPAPIPSQPMVAPPPMPGAGSGSVAGGNICLQLEQRLVAETQRGSQGRSQLPQLETEIRQVERTFQQAQLQLDRGDCYEQFLFVKTLRQTRSCVQAARQLEDARNRLSELSAQRQQMLGSSQQSYQDEIIRELARNGCGSQYVQEARRRDRAGSIFGGWQAEDDDPGRENQFGNLPFATYRTVCVRLCDGYFFPVSFSTLPNHFGRDAEVCASRCAAPAELYYHQNPGADMRQAVSARSQAPYTSLPTAFRHTRELVRGCSCKAEEYDAALTGENQARPAGFVSSSPPASGAGSAPVREGRRPPR